MKQFVIEKGKNPDVLMAALISGFSGNHITRTVDFYELFLVEEGDLYLEQDGERYHLKSGDIFIASPGTPFGGYKKSACSFFFVHIGNNGYISQSVINDAGIPKKSSLVSWSELAIIINEIISYHRNDNAKSVVAALTNSLFEILQYKINQPKEKIGNNKNFNKIIEDILFSPMLVGINSIDMIAKKYGYNARYLSSLFKKAFGTSFNEFLSKVKIDKAKRALVASDYKIKEIASMMGYRNDYFVKFFKKEVGVTPSDFRYGLTAKTEEFVHDANVIFLQAYKNKLKQ